VGIVSGASTNGTVRTEVVRADEIMEKIVLPIRELREPGMQAAYKKELRTYKKRLGKRQEVMIQPKREFLSLDEPKPKPGFVVKVYDEQIPVMRPQPPTPRAYVRSPYMRSGTYSMLARDLGLLADGGLYNRPIREERVREYAEKMQAGEWHDLLSDPFAITSDGHVLNGQHRIAATELVDQRCHVRRTSTGEARLLVLSRAPGRAKVPRDPRVGGTRLEARQTREMGRP
jgi:hypothetical protein